MKNVNEHGLECPIEWDDFPEEFTYCVVNISTPAADTPWIVIIYILKEIPRTWYREGEEIMWDCYGLDLIKIRHEGAERCQPFLKSLDYKDSCHMYFWERPKTIKTDDN